MKILLGPEYVSEEEETDSEEASEGEKEDARDTFVDRITVRETSTTPTNQSINQCRRVIGEGRDLGRGTCLPEYFHCSARTSQYET